MGLCGTGKPMKPNFKEQSVSTPENSPQQYPCEVRKWCCPCPDHLLWSQLDLGPGLPLVVRN